MKKQSIWVFEWRKSVHYWWSYISFSPECKELTSMLDPLLYRWGVPPVVIRCVHWTMQMWVLQTWIKALGLAIVKVYTPTSNPQFATGVCYWLTTWWSWQQFRTCIFLPGDYIVLQSQEYYITTTTHIVSDPCLGMSFVCKQFPDSWK